MVSLSRRSIRFVTLLVFSHLDGLPFSKKKPTTTKWIPATTYMSCKSVKGKWSIWSGSRRRLKQTYLPIDGDDDAARRDESSRRYFQKLRNLSQFSNKISYVNSVVPFLKLWDIFFGKRECGMITQFWNVADAVISNTDAVNNFERRPHFRIFGSITLILVIFGIQECHWRRKPGKIKQ